MRQILPRSLFFVGLFALIIFGILIVLLGLPTERTWSVLWEDFVAGLPFGIWIIVLMLALSSGIAWWSESLSRSKVQELDDIFQALLRNEDQTVIQAAQMKTLPNQLSLSILKLQKLLESQRKSLARISNERAETQDQIIQERLIMERQRLARELHDSVSQQLFAASMLLSSMTEQEGASPGLLQTEKMVQQAQLEMRALLLHLRPAALHDKSLRQGLFELVSELKEKVYFTIEHKLEEVPLPKGAEDHLFRIAQETLSNTLRHSKATEVHILFIERDNFAILRIQDNGVGFESEQSKSTSYGLKHIEERAIEIGATSKIVSVPSEGTIVEVKVPIERKVSHDSNLIG
ncbi:histidine kinase [Planococcus glaciei]|uniref:Sensor histidine kinase n=1 Tax=Planococcus glaciei TaxID=459472 RepID=A0A1G7VUL5_9BACL|nr:sensor histidine kinase [Planococcus glaciei]ETP69093.1 histidine kinase [Planococcus glaciei CHR43]KOF12227.1 histidine kinase [Planococcus glaciei]MBX0314321.1 sensor histidine kinase [Planococcus glaciei]QKX49736.1 sensor histidine kinase [Planococcus glaciei]SDG63502.1 two-component system, NarL family, sensor histidine kinase LiaS [Planococcus glaciei]